MITAMIGVESHRGTPAALDGRPGHEHIAVGSGRAGWSRWAW
jgi:hypothetical protein